MSSFENLQEVYYCSLESQSNIYSLTKVAISAEENRLLIASLRGKIVCVGFHERVTPISREVHFTYIPGDAEIVSIDAFRKCSTGVVVGIAFIKPYDGKSYFFLNVYSESEVGYESDLDRIAQGCQTLRLSFLPYQLYHTELYNPRGCEIVFLLSGADQKIHMFREAKNTHTFIEEEHIEDFFPEMTDLPGIVTRFHCVNSDTGHRRLTAIGCQNGTVVVSLVNVQSKVVLKSFQIQHDSPISAVHLFQLVNHLPVPQFLSTDIPCEENTTHEFHLLVASSLDPAVVYLNILEKEFSDALLLPESDSFDCTLCVLVADVDFDGENEIILGTYGQELLVYKLKNRISKSRKSSWNVQASSSNSLNKVIDESPSDNSSQTNFLSCSSSNQMSLSTSSLGREFLLVCRRSVPEPVMALEEVDLMSDGLNEIAVLTLKGLHVLQHDLFQASELCMQRLNEMIVKSNTDVTVNVITDETDNVLKDETVNVITDETDSVLKDETVNVIITAENFNVIADETVNVIADETVNVLTDETVNVITDNTVNVITDETVMQQ